MATIMLNDFERNLIFQTFRQKERHGNRRDARTTRRLLRSLGEEQWNDRLEQWENEAVLKGIAPISFPNGTSYNPYVSKKVNEILKPTCPESPYTIDYACAEYLYNELEKLDKAGQIPLGIDKWVDITDKIDEAWKVAQQEGIPVSKSDGKKVADGDEKAADAR